MKLKEKKNGRAERGRRIDGVKRRKEKQRKMSKKIIWWGGGGKRERGRRRVTEKKWESMLGGCVLGGSACVCA